MSKVNEQASEHVIELAKLLIDTLQRVAPGWQHGFLRINTEENVVGAKSTYVDGSGVHFLDVFQQEEAFARAIAIGEQLHAAMRQGEQTLKVCLLIVGAAFNYEVRFEYADPDKWAISKMDGATGIPTGITEADLAALGGGAMSRSVRRPWYRFW